MTHEEAAEDFCEQISAVGDDSSRFTAEESAEFYETIAYHCNVAARALREEI